MRDKKDVRIDITLCIIGLLFYTFVFSAMVSLWFLK